MIKSRVKLGRVRTAVCGCCALILIEKELILARAVSMSTRVSGAEKLMKNLGMPICLIILNGYRNLLKFLTVRRF